MAQVNKTMKNSKRSFASADEFEQLFFPQAYQEKQIDIDDEGFINLGIASDFLGEVQRQLPKKKPQKVTRSRTR